MNKAALRDLESLEKHHYKRMEEMRKVNSHMLAQMYQSMAETVRICIVTVQAAENREPD